METTGRYAKKTISFVLLVLVFILILLPVSTTFNELATKVVEKTELYKILQTSFIPYISRMVYVVIRYLPGLSVQPFPEGLKVNGTNVYINWNCLGWQSYLIFIATLFVGLRGPFTNFSKLQAIIFGATGTLLINIFRLTIITALVGYSKDLFKILFHNYFASFVTIIWLLFFWWFCYAFILADKRKESNES